jgi:hypothetical protein
MTWEEQLDTGINVAWIVGGAAFFAYQLAAGVLSATTTVLLEAERVEGSPGRVRVKLVLERGDAWIVEVVHATLMVDGRNTKLALPHPGKRLLRLAPNQRAQFSVIIAAQPDRDVELEAAVTCHQLGWWRESRFFAQAVVPASASGDR